MTARFSAAVLIPLLFSACRSGCENRIVDAQAFPATGKVAVVFTRHCGATTGPSTNVSVLDPGTQSPDGTGNAIVMKDPVSMAESLGTTRVRWAAADTLEISVLSGRSVQSRSSRANGVAIVLVTRER